MAKKWYISEKYLTDQEVSVRPKLKDLSLTPKSDIRFPQISFVKYIQELIDDGDLIVPYENIVEQGPVIISTQDPNPYLSIVNGYITIETVRPINYIVINGGDIDNDAQGHLTVTIKSKTLMGNTSVNNIAVPIVQKTDTSPKQFGNPSPANPYNIDLDNNPSVKVVGIGTANDPMIALKLYGLSNSYDNYSITIIPL